MECNEYKVIKSEKGKTYIVGTIYADSMPSEMPMDGRDVIGLSANVVFAIGMSIFTPQGMAVLFPNGWKEV